MLPDAVCELLDIIEHFTNTKILSIGNGPQGDELIYIKRIPASPRSTLSTVSLSYRKYTVVFYTGRLDLCSYSEERE